MPSDSPTKAGTARPTAADVERGARAIIEHERGGDKASLGPSWTQLDQRNKKEVREEMAVVLNAVFGGSDVSK